MQKIIYIPLGNHNFHKKIIEKFGTEYHLDIIKTNQCETHTNILFFYFTRIIEYVYFLLKYRKEIKCIITESTWFIPFIIKVITHNNIPIIDIAADPSLYYGDSRKYIKEKLYPKVGHYIAVGDMTKKLLQRKYNIPEERISILSPYNNETYNPQISFHSNKSVYIIGSWDYKTKGIDFSLDLINHYELYKDYTINVAGFFRDTNFLELYKKFFKVNFLGKISIQEKKDDIGIVLHLSRFDPFPVLPIELWQQKIPVFISNYTGTKEVIEHDEELKDIFIINIDNIEDEGKKTLHFLSLPDTEKIRLTEKCYNLAIQCNLNKFQNQFQEEEKKIDKLFK